MIARLSKLILRNVHPLFKSAVSWTPSTVVIYLWLGKYNTEYGRSQRYGQTATRAGNTVSPTLSWLQLCILHSPCLDTEEG